MSSWSILYTPESLGAIEHVRSFVRKALTDLYPRDSAKLLQGILIGEQQKLESSMRDDFVRTGLMHIVAVSGSNIVILTAFCLLLFRPFHWSIKLV